MVQKYTSHSSAMSTFTHFMKSSMFYGYVKSLGIEALELLEYTDELNKPYNDVGEIFSLPLLKHQLTFQDEEILEITTEETPHGKIHLKIKLYGNVLLKRNEPKEFYAYLNYLMRTLYSIQHKEKDYIITTVLSYKTQTIYSYTVDSGREDIEIFVQPIINDFSALRSKMLENTTRNEVEITESIIQRRIIIRDSIQLIDYNVYNIHLIMELYKYFEKIESEFHNVVEKADYYKTYNYPANLVHLINFEVNTETFEVEILENSIFENSTMNYPELDKYIALALERLSQHVQFSLEGKLLF